MHYERLELMRSAARVRRVHTMSLIHCQTVGEHTFGVIAIINEILEKPSRALLRMALLHDVPEALTGDTPAPIKWKFPALKELLDKAEEDVCKTHRLYTEVLSDEELKVLTFADSMELAMFALEEVTLGNQPMLEVANRALNYIEQKCLTDITPHAYRLHSAIRLKYEHMVGRILER